MSLLRLTLVATESVFAHVFTLGKWFDMPRIDAPFALAFVVEVLIRRNLSTFRFIHDSIDITPAIRGAPIPNAVGGRRKLFC